MSSKSASHSRLTWAALILLGSPALATQSRECPTGFFNEFDTYNCLPCPAGTYSDVISGGVCVRCPQGTYSVLPGSARCQACQPGYITSESGDSCDPCPVRLSKLSLIPPFVTVT
ncbi:hypothetical protein PG996_015903 [Apiospora saccharicola]|uniref:Tyrosine-protein kinase ephrin type A/B receptor-like domain-containing protein n=1 Tax=Apiospora saccharicola TaxID=335842 RepID=A0ABR1TQ41_9PEZI